MQRISFLFVFCFLSFLAYTQDQTTQLIKEGIELHDKGDMNGAIAKYDQALQLEPDNYKAKYEKSLSLTSLKKYEEAEILLKELLKTTKDPEYRKLSYINYGTIMDFQGDGKKSLKLYDEGIKEFPTSYLLYFNKGITQAGLNQSEDAIVSFKQSVKLNPFHGSSHNALGRLISSSNRIPAILSIFTFLLVEPEGKRASDNREFLYSLLMKGIEKKEGGGTNITIDRSVLDKKKKNAEDDFSSVELFLSFIGASNDIPDSLGMKTEADRLSFKLQSLINVIDETKKGKGFFKSFYVPFFAEMKKNDLVTIASYIALSSSKDETIKTWLKDNKDDVQGFYRWMENYKWVQ